MRVSNVKVIKLEDVLEALLDYHPDADVDLVKKAYVYAASKHADQTRYSGEPYIIHPLHVARFVCELKLDEVCVAAALLHDTLEDTQAPFEEIQELFGTPVANIVQGVTKLSSMNYDSREERQAETFRKMLLAMAKDIRVILVKLADRVHNIRTLDHTSEEQQVRVAQETMDIYAPLANRLGLYRVKSELEDGAFRYLHPQEFAALNEQLKIGEKKRQKFLDEVKTTIERELEKVHLKATVFARIKYRYSIFRKMQRQGVTLDEVYDVVAFRVLCNTVEQCWQVLGLIHQLWRPIPGRFRDFISLPKPNGYKSLHTSVIGPGAEQMEIQIRTWTMHEIAERGIAAHWKYKEGNVISPADEEKIRYLKQLIEELMDLNDTLRDSMELYSAIKDGLSFEEIFVFTPRGDVRNLPLDATPLDFAFSIHTEVGIRCTGARVNGIMAPIDHQLKNGDVVTIITSNHQTPSVDWLRVVKSSRAKAKIRGYLRAESKERHQQLGKILLEKELKQFSITLNKIIKNGSLKQRLAAIGLDREEHLFLQVGVGKLEAEDVARKIAEEMGLVKTPDEKPKFKPLGGLLERLSLSGKGKVLVGGQQDVMIRFAKCCNPIRGERIVGFVTRGRGITVHSMECNYVEMMDQERFVDVEWDRQGETGTEVSVKITSKDTPGMLTSISQVFSKFGLNIKQVVVRTGEEKADAVFKVDVNNVSQLKSIVRALSRVKGVLKVERIQS